MPISRYARLVRKRATSGPSWMRFEGLVKDGGELRSRTSRVGGFGGEADVMLSCCLVTEAWRQEVCCVLVKEKDESLRF